MFAGATKGLDRRSRVGLSLTSTLMDGGVLAAARPAPMKENMMRGQSLLLGGAILALVSIYNSADALAQNTHGKDCRMEQQCHWENFKKICVWVKVCR